MPVFVIVTPSSPSASTAVSEPVRVIEPLTVKVSLSAHSNWEVVADEIVVLQSPAHAGPPYKNKQRIINKLADLSSDFGTEIQYSERGVGEVILK